jgi:hypothetical protein
MVNEKLTPSARLLANSSKTGGRDKHSFAFREMNPVHHRQILPASVNFKN